MHEILQDSEDSRSITTMLKHNHDPLQNRKVEKGDNNYFCLAHQNRTTAIASDFRVDGAKSPEISQKEGVLGSEIAARNRKSLATFHRTLKSNAKSRKSLAISEVRDGHHNRKPLKLLQFRCAKNFCLHLWEL